ncbi:MAG TPA: SpoIVB peptidase S55 domain-containing protein [Candidatus Limnocylindria bacterium]|nr:SpoIVB peptidase S55 domain-containing protein [Candidatus Limnocylindria bacterium]
MQSALRRLCVAALAVLIFASLSPLRATDNPEIYPLSQVKPGMKGVAYTIFEGDQIEKMDLVVIGVLHNAFGPKQDIILIQLTGEKVERTGVVAGMSGSPVYFEGKLAGAISLKLGIFTKDAIGGVTPIENMLDAENSSAPAVTPGSEKSSAGLAPLQERVAIPENLVRQTSASTGQFLVPIETPLISSGLYPETLARFSKEFSAWGMAAMAGGTSAASPDDAKLQPGDMVGIDLIRGDLTISPGCTVTTVVGDRILACGHPVFGLGSVAMPLTRGHVLTTLSSSLASTKIMSDGGTIGTLTQDRHTAVMGKLGAGPPMIPMEVELVTPITKKNFHFEVIESPQLTPLLVALATFNGIVANPAYGEGFTMRLEGTIALKDHTPVRLENLFAPVDAPNATGISIALSVQGAFARIYSNPYELPKVEKINLRVTALSQRRLAMIDSAWIEKNEVSPGETVAVKVLLRPYRGAPFIQEIPITIPPQSARGTLQLVVSDAETLNRTTQSHTITSQAQLSGLEELIKLINRERQNDRLYATLFQPTPTLLIEDKELPNAPVSEINVLDQRQNPGGARLLHQSKAGEWSVEMHQVIAGEHTLTMTVK